MSENVSIEMFKIWADSQSKLLQSLSEDIKTIHQEQRETNNNIRDVVILLKEDVKTTRDILDHHVQEYDQQCDGNDARFRNLFQRQDKIDQILTERAPAWVVFKSFKKGLMIFVSALIVGAASALGGLWYHR